MPTYEFRCANGHTFDQFHKISDAPSTATCPICGAEAERAISGGAGLVFKGSGFYLTDYGKNAHRGGSTPPAKSGGESEGKGEGPGSKDAGGGAGSAKSGDGGSSGSNASGGSSSGGNSSTGTSTGGSGSSSGSTGKAGGES